MRQLVCEFCSGKNIKKINGEFICQECGCKYSIEDVKALLNDSNDEEPLTELSEQSSAPTGEQEKAEDVPSTSSEAANDVPLNLRMARYCFNLMDVEGVLHYYMLVLEEDKDDVEAKFFTAFGASVCSLGLTSLTERKEKFSQLNSAIKQVQEKYRLSYPEENLLERMNKAIVSLCTRQFVYNVEKGKDEYIVSTDAANTTALMYQTLYLMTETLQFFYLHRKDKKIIELVDINRKIGVSLHANLFSDARLQKSIDSIRNTYGQRFRDLQTFILNAQLDTKRSNSLLIFENPTQVVYGKWNGYPLRWHIVKTNGDECLLLCDDAIFQYYIDADIRNKSFAETEVATYLNNTFLERAFTTSERALMCKGKSVSLISDEDVQQSNVSRVIHVLGTQKRCWWWTSTRLNKLLATKFVTYSPNGERSEKYSPHDSRIGVRPTVWIKYKTEGIQGENG